MSIEIRKLDELARECDRIALKYTLATTALTIPFAAALVLSGVNGVVVAIGTMLAGHVVQRFAMRHLKRKIALTK